MTVQAAIALVSDAIAQLPTEERAEVRVLGGQELEYCGKRFPLVKLGGPASHAVRDRVRDTLAGQPLIIGWNENL